MPDDRLDDPSQACRDVARERDGLALDPCAAVTFFKSPVGIQFPEESLAFSGRLFMLGGLACVLDLRDLCCPRVAPPAGWTFLLISNIVLGGKDNRNYLFLEEPEKNAEMRSEER